MKSGDIVKVTLASGVVVTAEVLAVSGGWTTVILANGDTKKVRNGQIDSGKAKPAAKPRKSRDEDEEGDDEDEEGDDEDEEGDDEDEEGDESDEEGEGSRSVVPPPKKAKYRQIGLVDATGVKRQNCADQVADDLMDLDLDQTYAKAAKICKVEESDLRIAYGMRNPGMQRMILGNRIRATLRRAAKEKAAKEAAKLAK